MSDWTDELQPASFRGVPFGVLESESEFGRREAVHEYPYRDKPWIEDLGRGTRRIMLSGFLISDSRIYGGGDVIAQRDRMVGACETEGSGTLVHPTLGQLTVSVLRIGVIERHDAGRYFALQFELIEAGERVFPAIASDTGSASDEAADGLDAAAADDFDSAITPALIFGAPPRLLAETLAKSWNSTAATCGVDATSLFSESGLLAGNYGRYFGGRLTGFTGPLLVRGVSTLAALVANGATARAAIADAAGVLLDAVTLDSPPAIAAAAQRLAASVMAASVDPADGVRLLTRLADFNPDMVTGGSSVGDAVATTQTALAALFRRAAIGALTRATALYQPASADDAANLRDTVAAIMDAEITVAGDAGEDDTYSALRGARSAIVLDLNARGAALPRVQVFAFGSSLPSLTLANRIYRDAARADELVTEAAPRHPAFMPASFRALAA